MEHSHSHVAAAVAAHGHDEPHPVNLWILFVALSALTGGEVGLYELWRHTASEGHPFIPKFALVLVILVLTLPKAALVMIYFMHLKFEKSFIVMLAVIPLMLTFLAVLPTMTDILVLKERAYNKVESIGHYKSEHEETAESGESKEHGEASKPATAAPPKVEETY